MPRYFEPGTSILFLAFWIIVTWTWISWIKSLQIHRIPWRVLATFVGLSSATVSTVLNTFLLVHAQYTGGYQLMSPTELTFINYGMLTASLGLAAGLIARRRVGLFVAAISSIDFLLWVWDAVVQ